MSVTNFKTENNTLRKLFGNGLTYNIPRFQRDYSWDLEQWEDLWSDIIETMSVDGDSAHYMGYLVLQSTNDKNFDVIDGQQRLTTCSLLVLAILNNLKKLIESGDDPENNKQRLEQIRNSYIGYLDPVTLISKSKLTLNRNNNRFYQTYIVPLSNIPQRGLLASNHLLRKAFEWFDRQVFNYVKNSDNKGQVLAKFVEDLSDNLFFTVITVTDELNAYKVFETLNSRGIRLSSTDLLKNYLFSILDKEQVELSAFESTWDEMVSKLQSEKFPDFLRMHWNSRNDLTRQTELFKTIRKNITNKKDVFSLLRNMVEDLYNYLALVCPESFESKQENKETAAILKMLRVKQPYPLLLAAKRKFNSNDYTVLLNAIKVISIRYNTICANSPTEQERVYTSIANKISNGSIEHLSEVWPLLKPIYVDDNHFKFDFVNKQIKTTDARSNKIVKYILCQLEYYLSLNKLEYSSERFNIEHILPQNAPDDWGEFSFEESENMIYRLGNMTLLHSGANRELGNKSYSEKREVYKNSNFKITQNIASEYSEWNAQSIESRQKWMAKQACTIFKVSQLS